MITLARIIITILMLPFIAILMVAISFIVIYEVFWYSKKREAKAEGPDKI